MKLIVLNEKALLADGEMRKCYLHPEDRTKVVKIAKEKRAFFPDGNKQEWKHYKFLTKKYKNPDFIIKCYGYVDTNLGKGLMFDCARDHDGQVSKTILNIFSHRKKKYDESKVFSAVDSFCSFLIKNNIQFFDLNLGNVVIKVLSNDTYKAFAVDIKGRYANHEFIPVSTYIPFFSRKKLERRSLQLKQRMQHLSQNPDTRSP